MKVIAVVVNNFQARQREAQIKDILSRGKIARFTHRDIVKDVDTWNIDEQGDLTAFRTKNARTPFLCWDASGYDISEVDRDTPL